MPNFIFKIKGFHRNRTPSFKEKAVATTWFFNVREMGNFGPGGLLSYRF